MATIATLLAVLVGVLLLFHITGTDAVSGDDLNFNASLYHVIIPLNNVEAAGAYVFTVGFSRPLLPSELVLSTSLFGEAVQFAIQKDTLTVTTVDITDAGRYTFEVNVLYSGNSVVSLNAPAVVDVTSPGGQACLEQAFGPCSQLCEENSSEVYGYTCSCISGYSLQIDGLTCVADEPQQALFFLHAGGVAVFNPNTRVASSILSMSGVDAFDYSYQERVIYYVDNTHNVIARTTIDGTASENIADTGQQDIDDVAVDWLENILFFSDSNNGVISQLDLITFNRMPVISGLLNPRAIAVQPQAEIRLIFWIEGNISSSTIKRAFLNGTGLNSVATDLVNPIDITIDFVAGRLYWIVGDGYITSSSFNGMDIQTILFSYGIPAGITVFEDFVYISLRSNGTIARVDKLARKGSFPLYFNVSFYMNLGGISVYHPLVQSPLSQEIGDCAVNNGGCSQLCIVVNQPECQCHYGYKLGNDGTSCFPDQVSELLFSSVRRLSQSRGTILQSRTDGQLVATLVDTSHGPSSSIVTGLIYAMEYDLETGTLYYGDRNTSTLWKVPLQRLTSSQDDRTLLYSGVSAWGMAYDWINHYLYWTDDRNGSISSVLLSSLENVVVLATGLSQPQGIAVDPFNEWIYWTEAGKISRSRLDGSAKQTLFDNEIIQPSGIVVDVFKQRLLWGDTGSIQYSSLNGTGRTTLLSIDGLEPFQLGILGDYLAWTSLGSSQFSLMKLYDDTVIPSSLTLLIPSAEILPLVGLTVISSGQRISRGSAMCITNVLECTHYCNVDLQDQPQCMCPDGYNLLDDGRTCFSNTNDCSMDPCQNGGTCMNGVNGYTCDCPNGFTDEMCSTDIDECLSYPCENDGTCVNSVGTYSCECPVGFTDETCSTNVDNCISNPCQNDATCIDGTNDFTCECPAGFTDDVCSTNIDDCLPSSCLNGGTCIDGVNGYTCDCPNGFTDEMCSTDINECLTNPCENEGTCVNGIGTFSCECPVGFTDKACSTRINDCSTNPCRNDGTCVELIDDYACTCTAGFTGDICGVNIDDCSQNPCQNGGSCYDEIDAFRCECITGYTGADCSVEIDECASSPCQNGECINHLGNFTCDCFVGYTGRYCEEDIDECLSNICQNGATCINNLGSYSCSCAPGYTGSQCQNECRNGTFGQDCGEMCTCENNGTCNPVDGFCTCPVEYTGQNCEEPICSNPCINGGTCVQPDTCMCPETYGGSVCEIRVCTSDYCQNGGTCFVDFGINLACRCPSTTLGPQCQFLNTGFDPQTSLEVRTGVSVGVVLSVIGIFAIVVAIIVYFKCFRRGHRSQQLHYKSDLEYDNPVYGEAGQSLLGKNSNASALDNPIYGYYTSTHTEESSIEVDEENDNHTIAEFSSVATAANPKCLDSDVTALISPYSEVQDASPNLD